LISSNTQLKTGQRVVLNFKDGKTGAEIIPKSLF
jgi:hypothetical protein